MNLGIKFKEVRKQNNLSQEEMANILFTTQGNYSQFENNQRAPSIDVLKIMIEKFNLDANWLLSNSQEQIVNFNDQSTCNIAALKAENYYNIPLEKINKMENQIEEILIALKNK